MVTRISMENFRCIEKLKLPLKKINVFVGRNNTGKSSILYAIAVGTGNLDILPDNVLDTLIMERKSEAVIKVEDEINTKVKIKNSPEDARKIITDIITQILPFIYEKYKLKVDQEKLIPKIIEKVEKLPILEFTVKTGNKEKTIKTFLRPGYVASKIEDAIYHVKSFEESEVYLKYAPIYPYVKKIIPPIDYKIKNAVLYKEIENYIELKGEDKLDFELALQELLYRGYRVDIEGNVIILSKKANGEIIKRKIFIDREGDGFKALLNILNLFVKSKRGILLLEEPENHMHPGYINLLVKYLIEYYKKFDVQIFITTHSIDLIEALIAYLDKKKNIQKDFQIVHMSKRENTMEAEVMDYSKAKNTHKELQWDLRGI